MFSSTVSDRFRCAQCVAQRTPRDARAVCGGSTACPQGVLDGSAWPGTGERELEKEKELAKSEGLPPAVGPGGMKEHEVAEKTFSSAILSVEALTRLNLRRLRNKPAPMELQHAANLLRRLKPSDFVGDNVAPELVELRDAAKGLYTRGIIQPGEIAVDVVNGPIVSAGCSAVSAVTTAAYLGSSSEC